MFTLDRSLGVLGRLGAGHLGASWKRLRSVLGRLGVSRRRLGGVVRASWTFFLDMFTLERYWGVLECLGGVLGGLGGLGGFRGRPRSAWGSLGVLELSRPQAHLAGVLGACWGRVGTLDPGVGGGPCAQSSVLGTVFPTFSHKRQYFFISSL